MSNEVFPDLPGLAWSAFKTPTFSTKVQRATSGREQRASYWSAPLYTIKLTYDVLRENRAQVLTELSALMGFFMARQGSFDSFLFQDPDDFAIFNQVLGTGDGTTTSFNLTRIYGGFTEPVANFDAIYFAPMMWSPDTDADMWTDPAAPMWLAAPSYSAGSYTLTGNVVTFNTPPSVGQVVYFTASYYFRCRFTADHSEFEQWAKGLWHLKSCEFLGSLGTKI